MLRSYRLNFRKNWICQPSKWNLFWDNLKADMNDLMSEMESTDFSYDNINSKTEEIVKKVGHDGKSQLS